jgi:hypothetical protein
VRINLMRLALSLGIVGAVILPIRTGSIKRAEQGFIETAYDDDQSRLLDANNISAVDCMASPTLGSRYLTDGEKAICARADALSGQHASHSVTYHASAIIPLISDILVGFVCPFLFVIFVPRIARAYWVWLTR